MRPAVWGALLFSLILASCDLGPPVPDGAGPLADIGDCPSDESFFEHRVWAAVLSQSCQECHHAEGLAGDTALVLAPESDPQWLATNFATLLHHQRAPIRIVKHLGSERAPSRCWQCWRSRGHSRETDRCQRLKSRETDRRQRLKPVH